MSDSEKVPPRAWVVTFAGTAINLCLGILYAWSVWKSDLVGTAEHPPGTPMSGVNEGWIYLTDAQATWAYALCGSLFALAMIPGGRIQDRHGPRVGATLGGVCLASGCIVAGLMKSYLGLLVGFGILGGIGMGLGYASATPAAVRWFGPHRRGLVVGLVVGGYGGAAIYISPLAKYLITEFGLSRSFILLGGLFAVVIIVAGRLLASPPADYVPAGKPIGSAEQPSLTRTDWTPREMSRTWQFHALLFLFFGSAQTGLLVIANAAPLLNRTATSIAFFAANAWILSSFGGLVNATGRVCTGLYSDRIGRVNAYRINGLIAALGFLLLPTIIESGSIPILFLVVGLAYWQYGGGLALMPAITADYFGPRHLGSNYGLVFLGWGLAFLVPQAAGYIKDATGSLDPTFYLSGAILLASIALSFLVRRPISPSERA